MTDQDHSITPKHIPNNLDSQKTPQVSHKISENLTITETPTTGT